MSESFFLTNFLAFLFKDFFVESSDLLEHFFYIIFELCFIRVFKLSIFISLVDEHIGYNLHELLI